MFVAQGARAGHVADTFTPAGNWASGKKSYAETPPSWRNSALSPFGAESIRGSSVTLTPFLVVAKVTLAPYS